MSSVLTTQDCGRAEVLVFFRREVGRDQAHRVIAAENVLVIREYPALRGYALAISNGQRDRVIASLRQRSEVIQVAPSRCNQTN